MKRTLTLALALLVASGAGATALTPPPPAGDSDRLLDEIIRLTTGGFSDQTVLAFVKARRADIPPILTAEDFVRLRKTGVAEAVIGYLTGASAIELNTAGRTAAMDAEPAKEPAYVPQPVYQVPPYLYGYGGGFISPSPFFLNHHFFRHHPFLPAQPGFPRIGPNGFPILASPNMPGGRALPIGANGFPVLSGSLQVP